MKNSFTVFLLMLFTGVFAQDQVMTPELLWKLGRVSMDCVSPDGQRVVYGVTYYDVQKNGGSRDLYIVNVDGSNTRQITDMEGSEHSTQYTADGDLLFVNGGQLWLADEDGSNAVQITNDDEGYSNLKLSSDNKHILFTRDVKFASTTADLYPELKKAEARVIDGLNYRHWDHWEDELVSHVFYATFDGKNVGLAKDIMKGEPYDAPLQPFGGAEELAWSADGKHIAYTCKKAESVKYAQSTNSDIYIYNIENGETINLTEGMMGYDVAPQWNKAGSQIAWLSMRRDGYEADKNDIVIYDFDSKEKHNVTAKWDETVTGFEWNNKGDKIYFRAGVNATYQVFELDLPKKLSEVTPEDDIRQVTKGRHNIGQFAVAGKNIVATKQHMNQANELYAYSIKKGNETALSHVNDEIYASIKTGEIQERWITTTDGKKMLTWVILPPNFDPNKKYPALLYCQGGPQSAVSQFYSFRWNFQLMAANDYIIIAPNRRGLPSFGTEWNEAISKDWGGQPMDDYLSAVDELKKEPYIDEDRIGAIGASYGGYSVYMLAGIHEGRFNALVSHCGLFDMKSWYGTTEELFFANFDLGGPYWLPTTPKAYTTFNPSNYVQNWTAPIFVIHGGKDFRVPEGQGMQAFQAAQVQGVPSKFLYFPNEGHWVLKPQNGLIWHSEFFKFLDEYLKP